MRRSYKVFAVKITKTRKKYCVDYLLNTGSTVELRTNGGTRLCAFDKVGSNDMAK